MRNLLLEQVDYKLDETPLGTWRRFMYADGSLFQEFISHQRVFGFPLLHYTYGKSPETGRRVVAKGVIAVGRLAVGLLAIGHASFGLIAIGQLALGVLLGLGQASTGLFALGQAAVAVVFGVGQLTTGYAAIGQVALGKYVLAQIGFGEHVWDSRAIAPAAREFFRPIIP